MDEMSSERFRERLLSAEQPAIDQGRVASRPLGLSAAPPGLSAAPPGRSTGSLHRPLVTDVPLPAAAQWNPQNWRLRTKLIALTVVPLLLAVVLGALQIADSAKNSSSAAVRDLVIIGVALLLCVALLIVVARSILKPLRVLRASAFDVADRRLPADHRAASHDRGSNQERQDRTSPCLFARRRRPGRTSVRCSAQRGRSASVRAGSTSRKR